MMVDSVKAATDSLANVAAPASHWGWANVTANHGLSVTWSGLLVVFLGLGLIALMISAFNLVAEWLKNRAKPVATGEQVVSTISSPQGKEIPEDHLIAITTAVELYRRLHLDPIRTRVTFVRGELHTPWKTGFKYGQRIVPEKRR